MCSSDLREFKTDLSKVPAVFARSCWRKARVFGPGTKSEFATLSMALVIPRLPRWRITRETRMMVVI